ncbi:700_t:CDS:2 [Diversispora eburnea]|uniref:700_t:CDS:1 n=1 Tax=Diversispora eburnea TaxID=1213867 RepID=A0A9N9GGH1_9GLOM|nr:700_t:CDS:2 [Diversispora eburnea]
MVTKETATMERTGKLMVIHYLEFNRNNKRGTAKRFNIQPKQVRDWYNNKEKLLRANQNPVTRKMMTKKATELSRNKEFLKNHPNVIKFKFSSRWLDGFLSRYDLSNRRRTTVAQHLPSDLIEKQNVFLSYILYRRIQFDYPLKYIGNMDETPMWFDLPSNTTIDHKGTKTVNIRTTGHERSSFTVVLTCMADRINEKGWMNEEEMLWWIENVWVSRNPFNNTRSMLVLDSFRGHIEDSVKNRLAEKNTNIAVIPGGCTSKLQPLDVAINKVRERYNEWMSSSIKILTPAGRIKKPSYSTVATWIKESWDEVDINLIQKSFKCCGISTKTDGGTLARKLRYLAKI